MILDVIFCQYKWYRRLSKDEWYGTYINGYTFLWERGKLPKEINFFGTPVIENYKIKDKK